MREMELRALSGSTSILLGEGIANLRQHCPGAGKIIVITDRNVAGFHRDKLDAFDVIEIEPGEENKTLDTVEAVYGRMLSLEVDRSDMVVGVGGGIACDVAGFAASTYMRGVPFGFVPTTLLAMVDASIGGKNGVNLKGYKNLVGTIRQPRFCLCDFDLLRTLPENEMRRGFAEVVKHAAIGDAALFSFLEENWEKAFTLHRTSLEKIVHDSIAVKASIVSKDEGERGERMKLNLGHTIGHALEKATGLPHGEAVSAGMAAEAGISVSKKMLTEKEAGRLGALLGAIGLPVRAEAEADDIIDAIRKDKKRSGGTLRMSLLEGIGKARIVEVGLDELEKTVRDMCQRGQTERG